MGCGASCTEGLTVGWRGQAARVLTGQGKVLLDMDTQDTLHAAYTERCMQGGPALQMAMSTALAVCPGRGHTIRLGPPEPPGPLKMPSDMSTVRAARQSGSSKAE